MPTKPLNQCLVACIVVALGSPGAPAFAAPSDDLRDLVDVKGASGESELEKRGYTHIDTDKDRNTAYSYWWSNAKSSCIRVTTRDGRYQALIDVDPSDCGQTKKESGMSDGAKVAIAAAALAGVAALAHKSHHRDDRNFNEQQTANFERGYRDGLYNNSFDSRGAGNEYRDGYNQGVSERTQQSSYRYGGGGGYNSGWTRCASEGEYCRVDGSARVRFGGDNRYAYRNVTGGIQCSTRQFGDPAYGLVKACEVMSMGGGYGNVSSSYGWDFCANEGGFCSFSGPAEVRFGSGGRFVTSRGVNGLPCDVEAFGNDPAYGQKKQCFVRRNWR